MPRVRRALKVLLLGVSYLLLALTVFFFSQDRPSPLLPTTPTYCNATTAIVPYSSSVMHLASVCHSHAGLMSLGLETLPCPSVSTTELIDQLTTHIDTIHAYDTALDISFSRLRADIARTGGIWADYPFSAVHLAPWQKNHKAFEALLLEKFLRLDKSIQDFAQALVNASMAWHTYRRTRHTSFFVTRFTDHFHTAQSLTLRHIATRAAVATSAIATQHAQSQNLSHQLTDLIAQFQDIDTELHEYYSAYIPVPPAGERPSARLRVVHKGQRIALDVTTGRTADYIRRIVSANRKQYKLKGGWWGWVKGEKPKIHQEKSWLDDEDDEDEYLYDYLGFGMKSDGTQKGAAGASATDAGAAGASGAGGGASAIDRLGLTHERLAAWQGAVKEMQTLCDRATQVGYAVEGARALGVAVRVLEEKKWLVRQRDLEGGICGV